MRAVRPAAARARSRLSAGRALLGPASILLIGFWAGPAPGAASPQELEQIRSALLAARPGGAGSDWPSWQVADAGCASGGVRLDDFEAWAIAEECGMESIGFLTELWQVAFPEGEKSRAREGVEFVGAGLGVPVSAVKCAARGTIVHQLRRMGRSEAEIEAWRKRIDAVAEAAAILDTLRQFRSETLGKGPGEYLTADGVERAAGEVSTVSGMKGSLEKFSAAWYSFHRNRVASFDARAAEAKSLVGECRLPEAERLATDLLGDALDYLRDKRLDVVHYEKKVLCEAAAADPGLAVPARIAASWSDGHRREALRAEAEVARAVDGVESALRTLRQESARTSRERDAFLAEVDAVVGRYDSSRRTCDRAGLLEQRSELQRLAGHRCAAGAGKADDLAQAISRIDLAIRALDDVALPLGTARDEARAALRACRTEAAREALDRGRKVLEAAASTSPIPLEVCPEVELWFPAAALDAEVAARRTELAGRKQRARDFLAQARVAAGGCRFEEAWGLHEAAGRELGSCTVEASDCGDAGRFDRDLCTLFQLGEERRKAEADLTAAEARFHEASATIASRGQELQAWGREALARAAIDAPERCVALTEAREAAQGLETLAAPLDCPDPRIQAYRDEGPKLRARAEEIEAGLSRREADLLAAAESAASACDAAALKEALGGLERLQPVSCGRAVADLGPLRRRLAEVEDLTGQARTILREAEEDLAAWLGRCDPSRLKTAEARISNLVRCGWESLTEAEQARARVLRDWGANSAELDRLKTELSGAGLPLSRAVTYIAAAEGRLAGGDRSEESRRAFGLEKERAAASLAEARAILDRVAAAPRMSKACLARPREDLAAGEDRLARLGDLLPAPERNPSAGAATGRGTGAPGVETGGGEAAGTGASPVSLAGVTVPDLRGKSRAMAEAWLEDLGLRPVVTTGGGARTSVDAGKVASQTHPAGSRLPAGSFVGVSLWGPHAAAEPAPSPVSSSALAQSACDREWPGTVLRTDPATGATSCQCPEGKGWSRVRRACLALPTGAVGAVAGGGDCRHMPGTLRDSRTGECRCPVGTWDATLGRCVDTAAAAREADLAGRRKAADCEDLFSQIRIFRSNPDALSRNMATHAESQARALGCDSGRIVEATGGGAGGGSGRDSPVVPVTGPVEDKHEGEARVSSRNVNVCIIDVNDVLDDHYELFVNGGHVGGVANPEGGATCYGAFLRGGPNSLVLKLVATRGKGTYLKISINNDEFSANFGGSKNHVWNVVAP